MIRVNFSLTFVLKDPLMHRLCFKRSIINCLQKIRNIVKKTNLYHDLRKLIIIIIIIVIFRVFLRINIHFLQKEKKEKDICPILMMMTFSLRLMMLL